MEQTQLQQIIADVKSLVGNEYLYLDTCITILTNNMVPFNIWGLCVSPTDVLYVMDCDQQWYAIDEVDSLLIPKILEALNRLKKRYKGIQKQTN